MQAPRAVVVADRRRGKEARVDTVICRSPLWMAHRGHAGVVHHAPRGAPAAQRWRAARTSSRRRCRDRRGAGGQRQLIATISTGSAMPFRVTVLGWDAWYRDPAAVTWLARISPAPAKAAILDASCTPLPRKFWATWVASEACTPILTCGANPWACRCSASRRWMATAHVRAASGE